MSVIDELVTTTGFAERVDRSHLDLRPSRRLAIVTCMDSRIDVFAALGLRDGEAHVLRNAGGVREPKHLDHLADVAEIAVAAPVLDARMGQLLRRLVFRS